MSTSTQAAAPQAALSVPHSAPVPAPGTGTGPAPADGSARISVTAPVTASGRRQRRSPKTRDKDNGEFFGFMSRLFRAVARRVQAEDPSDLAGMLAMQAQLDAVIADTARKLHENDFSWAEIGQGAGISKHAAFKRWAR